MKSRSLIVVVVILAVVAIVAYRGLRERTSTPGVFKGRGENLCPDLDAEAVERIVIEKDDIRVALEKTDEGWINSTESGFPADESKVNSLISQIKEIKITDRRSTKEENHHIFEVTSEEGTTLTISYTGGQDVARLVFGKSPDYQGVFARIASKNDVYLVEPNVSYRLGLDYNTKEVRQDFWIDKKITDFDQKEIGRIALQTPDGETVVERVAKEKPESTAGQADETGGVEDTKEKEETIWKVTSPEEFEADENVVNTMTYYLARMRAADLVAKEELSEFGLDNPQHVATAILKDGSERKILFGNKTDDNNYYTKLDGGEIIYLVAEHTFNSIFKKPEDLKMKPREEEGRERESVDEGTPQEEEAGEENPTQDSGDDEGSANGDEQTGEHS
jgi:hypothetical protein